MLCPKSCSYDSILARLCKIPESRIYNFGALIILLEILAKYGCKRVIINPPSNKSKYLLTVGCDTPSERE